MLLTNGSSVWSIKCHSEKCHHIALKSKVMSSNGAAVHDSNHFTITENWKQKGKAGECLAFCLKD